MSSRKPSARAKRVAAFRSKLAGADDAFERESKRSRALDVERERRAEKSLRLEAAIPLPR